VLNKKSCQLCFQKHEKFWDEEEWTCGFVSCPHELIHITKNGVNMDDSEMASLFRCLFQVQDHCNDDIPSWCEFEH